MELPVDTAVWNCRSTATCQNLRSEALARTHRGSRCGSAHTGLNNAYYMGLSIDKINEYEPILDGER